MKLDALTQDAFDPEKQSRIEHRAAKVLDYINENPRCTTREIAIAVFGGTGKSHSSERAATHAAVAFLVAGGQVSRQSDFDARGNLMYLYAVPHDGRGRIA